MANREDYIKGLENALGAEGINRLDLLLQKYFPNIGCLKNLYPEQLETITAILTKPNDLLTIMPTGKGKSVCYQLPALYWEDKVTIVISPLSALIVDQLKPFKSCKDDKDRPVATVYAGRATMRMFDREQTRTEVLGDLLEGIYRLVYISPEMLTDIPFLKAMRRCRDRIKMITVDEAHCLSLWGQSFRPAYLEIRHFVDSFGKNRPLIAAFTATATRNTINDIQSMLGLRCDPKPDFDPSLFDRGEITYHIERIPRRSEGELKKKYPKKNDREIKDLIEDRIKIIKKHRIKRICTKYAGKKADKKVKGIIFCTTVYQVNDVYRYLNGKQCEEEPYFGKVSKYYAEMSTDEKSKSLESFRGEGALIMVATNAFGMGINMNGQYIGYCIHYNIPLSIENYCQESGRIARGEDPRHKGKGPKGDAYLLYAPGDEEVCMALIKNKYLQIKGKGPSAAERRVNSMVNAVQVSKGQPIETKNKALKNKAYNISLHKMIVDYFSREADAEESNDVKRTLPLFVNSTNVANQIRNGKCYDQNNDNGFVNLKLSTVEYRLFETDEAGVEQPVELSYFDMMIADAVYSLWIHNVPITCRSIWEILSGDEKSTKVHGEKAELIRASLYKLYNTQIELHDKRKSVFIKNYQGRFVKFTEESMKAYKESVEEYKESKKAHMEDDSVKIKKVEVSLELAKTPPIYEYAEDQEWRSEKKRAQIQVFTYEQLRLLKIQRDDMELRPPENDERLPSSVLITTMKHYLLRRMCHLPDPRSKMSVHRIIVLDGLLEKLGLLGKVAEKEGKQKEYRYTRLHKTVFGSCTVTNETGEDPSYQDVTMNVKRNEGKVDWRPWIKDILDYYIWLKKGMSIGNLEQYELYVEVFGCQNKMRERLSGLEFATEILYDRLMFEAFSLNDKQEYMISKTRLSMYVKNHLEKGENEYSEDTINGIAMLVCKRFGEKNFKQKVLKDLLQCYDSKHGKEYYDLIFPQESDQ